MYHDFVTDYLIQSSTDGVGKLQTYYVQTAIHL